MQHSCCNFPSEFIFDLLKKSQMEHKPGHELCGCCAAWGRRWCQLFFTFCTEQLIANMFVFGTVGNVDGSPESWLCLIGQEKNTDRCMCTDPLPGDAEALLQDTRHFHTYLGTAIFWLPMAQLVAEQRIEGQLSSSAQDFLCLLPCGVCAEQCAAFSQQLRWNMDKYGTKCYRDVHPIHGNGQGVKLVRWGDCIICWCWWVWVEWWWCHGDCATVEAVVKSGCEFVSMV